MSALRNDLPDHASEADVRAVPIERVGVGGLSWPVRVLDRDRNEQHTIATLDLGVSLPADRKGTHMSRFIELMCDEGGELTFRTMPRLLTSIQERLEATDAYVDVRFPYFLPRAAPVSGAVSPMRYEARFSGRKCGEHGEYTLGVQVPVTTLCPCSKAVSRYGAHNQRGLVDVSFISDEFVWLEQIIEAVEACASSPLFALLKREDEKHVTERAYENPRFVEDLVRDVLLALRDLPGARRIEVRVENLESIHLHSAVAQASWSRDDQAPVTDLGRVTAPRPPRDTTDAPSPFGAWVRTQRSGRGLSQRALGDRLGMSASHLSRVEAGEKTLSVDALQRLAEEFSLEEEDVFLRAGVVPPALLARIAADPDGFRAWATN